MKSFSLCFAVLTAWGFASLSYADTPTRWSGTSEIAFSGTSTLHDWGVNVAAEPFTITVIMDDSGNPVQLTGKVEVKASTMDTAEPDRDANMRKCMKVSSYPIITATFDAPFSQIMAGRAPAKLPFSLDLVGKKQDVIGTISNWQLKGDKASFDLDLDLSLKKCGVTVPSVLLVIRVGDIIKLHSTVKLNRVKA
jgi:hypothetical protein